MANARGEQLTGNKFIKQNEWNLSLKFFARFKENQSSMVAPQKFNQTHNKSAKKKKPGKIQS